MRQLTHGSLFAGIGGFDLGFERAGMKTVWQVEIDEYCRRVLARHFPDAERFGDIRECGKHNLRPVDVLAGGFPCQDISNAGRRAGIDGERSGLWSEYSRIIRELRPRFIIVENVSALLARGLGRVLGDLAACGYDAEWDCIPASAIGAPHRRDRIWIVAYPASIGRSEWREARDVFGKNGRPDGQMRSKPSSASVESEDLAHPNSERFPIRDEAGHSGQEVEGIIAGSESLRVYAEDSAKQWEAEPNVGRVADGVPNRVDRLRALGNSIVPQIAEWIGRRIIEASQGEEIA